LQMTVCSSDVTPFSAFTPIVAISTISFSRVLISSVLHLS
jgi:hypothetical protein